jgi:hypothetical protein
MKGFAAIALLAITTTAGCVTVEPPTALSGPAGALHFDGASSCRAKLGWLSGRFEHCLENEREAAYMLPRAWERSPEEARSQCVQEHQGDSSNISLSECLRRVTREVRRREEEQERRIAAEKAEQRRQAEKAEEAKRRRTCEYAALNAVMTALTFRSHGIGPLSAPLLLGGPEIMKKYILEVIAWVDLYPTAPQMDFYAVALDRCKTDPVLSAFVTKSG